jgi:hypothetical protein
MGDGRAKNRIKLGVQIQNLLELFGRFHWKTLSAPGHTIKSYARIAFIHRVYSLSFSPLTFSASANEKQSVSDSPLSPSQINTDLHDKLIAMEFDSDSVRNVLTWTSNESGTSGYCFLCC